MIKSTLTFEVKSQLEENKSQQEEIKKSHLEEINKSHLGETPAQLNKILLNEIHLSNNHLKHLLLKKKSLKAIYQSLQKRIHQSLRKKRSHLTLNLVLAQSLRLDQNQLLVVTKENQNHSQLLQRKSHLSVKSMQLEEEIKRIRKKAHLTMVQQVVMPQ